MTLKLRKRSLFPASVTGTSPIVITKVGAAYTFSLDGTALTGSLDTTLQGLAALDSTAGLLTQIAVDTFTKRTLTGTANEITVTNGAGTAGNPTLSLPAALTFTGKTVTGGTFTGGTWNNITFTQPATGATLTIADGKTVSLTNSLTIGGVDGKSVSFSNSLTFAGVDSSTLTFQGTDTYVGRATADTFTGVKTFNNGKFVLAGSTSGSTVVNASATASGTLTLPAATDTLVGRATTDTLTNKTIDTAGPNTIKVGGVSLAVGQFPGTTIADNATAGNIGEYSSSAIGSAGAISLSSGVTSNITSLLLTAGDWDVFVGSLFLPGSTTNATFLNAGISTTSATLPTVDGLTATQWANSAGQVLGSSALGIPTCCTRISVASTTIVYFVAQATFTVSTMKAYGMIRARRVR